MAKVRIEHVWADGRSANVEVKVDASFPDSISEAKATAVAALRDTIAAFEVEAEDEQ